jgi:hypothetical protein
MPKALLACAPLDAAIVDRDLTADLELASTLLDELANLT